MWHFWNSVVILVITTRVRVSSSSLVPPPPPPPLSGPKCTLLLWVPTLPKYLLKTVIFLQVHVGSDFCPQTGHCFLHRCWTDCHPHQDLAVHHLHNHLRYSVSTRYWNRITPCWRSRRSGCWSAFSYPPGSGFRNTVIRHLLRDLEGRQIRHPSVHRISRRVRAHVRTSATQ